MTALMTEAPAGGYVIMDGVSDETAARVVRAGRRYSKADAEMDAARAELVEAMSAHKAEGNSVETVARLTPLSNTQVFRMLKAAEQRKAAAPAES